MFKTLEKKYGIHVRSEGIWCGPYSGVPRETFAIYTADGCCWEKGLSRFGVKAECLEWGAALLSIKENMRRESK